MLKKYERAWLASAIDGEGTIMYESKYHTMRIGVYNTHRGFAEYAKKLLGANLYIKKATKNRIELYRVEICDKERIKNVLKQIIPFLIIKQDKAKNLLEVANNKGRYNTKKCTECNDAHYSRGWCQKHWYENFGSKYHKSWRTQKSQKVI